LALVPGYPAKVLSGNQDFSTMFRESKVESGPPFTAGSRPASFHGSGLPRTIRPTTAGSRFNNFLSSSSAIAEGTKPARLQRPTATLHPRGSS
jgi:hypothetical protein